MVISFYLVITININLNNETKNNNSNIYLFFFFESFLNIEEEGDTGNGGLKWRVVTRLWLGCSWRRGDSKGESKNVDEVSFKGEYAGGGWGLSGKSVCAFGELVVSASLLSLGGESPSCECFKLVSSCSDITNFFLSDVCSFKWQ